MELEWTKANWPDKTYHAEIGELSYTIDWAGREWSLRGWKNGAFCTFRTATTMRELKVWAASHASINS